MKIISRVIQYSLEASILLVGCLHAQVMVDQSVDPDESQAIAAEITRITEPINIGETPLNPPEKPLGRFQVLSEKTWQLGADGKQEKLGPTGASGLVKLTVQRVKKPEASQMQPSPPTFQNEETLATAELTETAELEDDTVSAYVSATVYDHKRTFFRCSPVGGEDRVISGWSNLDFNHFTGFSTFQVEGSDGVIRNYSFTMAIGNETTTQSSSEPVASDKETNLPAIPPLADISSGNPDFRVTLGDKTDKEAMELVIGLHRLYGVEGKRMEAAYQSRVKACEDRDKALLANPPKHKDVMIRCWKTEGSGSPAATNQLGTTNASK